jgi:hypothetical protein
VTEGITDEEMPTPMPAKGARVEEDRRPPGSRARNSGHGRRQTAKMTAAETIRSQATPGGSTRAKRSTANDGPR